LEPGADRLEVEMLACIGFAPRLHSRFRVVRPRRLRPGGIVGRIGQFGVGAQRRGENHPVVLEEGYFFRVLRLALPLATGFALALGAGFAGTAALPFPFGLAVGAFAASPFGAAMSSAKLSSIQARKKAMSGITSRSDMIEKAIRPL